MCLDNVLIQYSNLNKDNSNFNIVYIIGSCKHALAFLMLVHHRSEDPSPTDVTSYWVRPRLSAIGTSLKFVAASDFTKIKRDAPLETSSFKEELINTAV